MLSRAKFYCKPVVYTALAYLIGTVVGIKTDSGFALCAFVAAALSLLLFCFNRTRIYLFLAAVLLFSFGRASYSTRSLRATEERIDALCESGGYAVVSGSVASIYTPKYSDRDVRYAFLLKDIHLCVEDTDYPRGESVFVLLYCKSEAYVPALGDRLELTGRFIRGRNSDPLKPELNDYILISDDGHFRPLPQEGGGDPITEFRERARMAVSSGLDDRPEERDLLLAMTLGYRAELDKGLSESFRRAGTIHIFAISGLHVGAIAVMLVMLLSFMGLQRKYVIIPLAPLLASYIYMTGMQPSAIRAGIMVAFYYFALIVGRRPSAAGSLAATLLLILSVRPAAVEELSLILSFSMVAGIIFFTDKITSLIFNLSGIEGKLRGRDFAITAEASGDKEARVRRWPTDGIYLLLRFVIEIFSASFAASLISIPLTAYYFGTFSTYSAIANMVVVPLSLPIMVFFGIGLFVAIVMPPLTPFFNQITASLAGIMKNVSIAISELPCSSYDVNFPLWALILWYVVLYLVFATRSVAMRRTRRNKK